MHLLVLSAFRPQAELEKAQADIQSQCTFWCSVLSDSIIEITTYSGTPRLNAPSGAQCFPTWVGVYELGVRAVSMHLLVLSAFRPTRSCR